MTDPLGTQLHDIRAQLAQIGRAVDDLTQQYENARLVGGDMPDGPIASPIVVVGYIATRRRRERFFPQGLFGDPAWDMLLDLWVAREAGRRVSVSSLCIASAVPPTTALRWIGLLERAELIERSHDPHDRRRAFIHLSRQGCAAMTAYLRSIRPGALPAPVRPRRPFAIEVRR